MHWVIHISGKWQFSKIAMKSLHLPKIRIITTVPEVKLSIRQIAGILPPHIRTIVESIQVELSNDTTHADISQTHELSLTTKFQTKCRLIA